jgi:hypothetical protein
VSSWLRKTPLQHRFRLLAAATALSCMPVAAASAETPSPSPAARIAHAEFLPYMDPPPGGAATVCLVDTGVDLNPDTASNVIERVALDAGDGGDVWPGKHGTEMAMAMGAPINGWGTVGAWPLVKIVSVRVMAPGAADFPFGAYSKGVQVCLKRPSVRVINLSFSGPRPSDADVTDLDDYVAGARRADVSIIAGAGNHGGEVEWPAADPVIMAVAAADSTRTFCDFSATGAGVSVAAPGCGLELADSATGEPIPYAGASPAGAFTSAVVAAVRSYRPDLTAAAAEDLLRATATDAVLDVEAAFRAAGLSEQVDRAIERSRANPVEPSISSTTPTTPDGGRPRAEVTDRTELRPRARWPAPRVRVRACASRAVALQFVNRPPRATAVVRLYRRAEFGRRLVAEWKAFHSQVRIARSFGFGTVRFTGHGRSPSSTVRFSGWRGHR